MRCSASRKRPRKPRSRSPASQVTKSICPFVTADQTGPKHISSKTLSRRSSSNSATDLFERTIGPVIATASRTPNLETSEIDRARPRRRHDPHAAVSSRPLKTRSSAKTPHQGVNPDEVVAIGAAIQGGVLKGDVKDVLLLDVTPLYLGIETLRRTLHPAHRSQHHDPDAAHRKFSPPPRQPARGGDRHVLQGERPMSQGTTRASELQARWHSARPRGVPQIEVTFDIDANGILNVSAQDKATGKSRRFRSLARVVSPMTRSRKAQTRRRRRTPMRLEAQVDRASNEADRLAHQVEKQLEEMRRQAPRRGEGKLKSAIAAA